MVTASDVRELLDGYGIDTDLVKNTWIDNRLNNFIIPWVEKRTRQSFLEIKQTTEFHSGTGSQVILLDRSPIIDLIDIELVRTKGIDIFISLDAIEVIRDEGTLKVKAIIDDFAFSRTFPRGNKNIKVTYTFGFSTIQKLCTRNRLKTATLKLFLLLEIVPS